jgi:hypothetical protein
MMEADGRRTGMGRRIGALALALTCAALLAACTASPAPTSTLGGESDMDKEAVAAQIAELPGVEEAEVGAFNTGTPGSYGALVQITVDEAGLAAVGEVIDASVRIIAVDPGPYRTFDFELTAPDETGEPIIETLSRYRDRIPFAEGTYLGSNLTLTAGEVAAVAAR